MACPYNFLDIYEWEGGGEKWRGGCQVEKQSEKGEMKSQVHTLLCRIIYVPGYTLLLSRVHLVPAIILVPDTARTLVLCTPYHIYLKIP